jgi:hypothetical protein
MGLFSQVMWWGGTLLLAAMLFRLAWTKLFVRYRYFSAYLACAFGCNLVLLYLQPVTSRKYALAYWTSEFVCAALAFGVTWEIYAHALAPYGGVRRMARAVVTTIFVLVGAKAGVELWGRPLAAGLGPTTLEFERNLRVVQALLLLAIVGLVVHYALPLGRNLRALLTGYGIYLAVLVVSLALRAELGPAFQPWLRVLQPLGWNVTVGVWIAGMWSYSQTSLPVAALECDYERISRETAHAFGQLRNHMIHSFRL